MATSCWLNPTLAAKVICGLQLKEELCARSPSAPVYSLALLPHSPACHCNIQSAEFQVTIIMRTELCDPWVTMWRCLIATGQPKQSPHAQALQTSLVLPCAALRHNKPFSVSPARPFCPKGREFQRCVYNTRGHHAPLIPPDEALHLDNSIQPEGVAC